MTIPQELLLLSERIQQELNQTETLATQGLSIVREILEQFPETAVFIQFFAYFSSVLLFVETNRTQIQTTVEYFLTSEVNQDKLQEVGEDWGMLLGKVLETKIKIEGIINRLERLR